MTLYGVNGRIRSIRAGIAGWILLSAMGVSMASNDGIDTMNGDAPNPKGCAVLSSHSSPFSASPLLMKSDRVLLADLENRAFLYFRDQSDPVTGLTKDRASNFGEDHYKMASIAATGFGLAALAVGAKRGYLPRREAYRRVLKTLRFVESMTNEHGWLYHFIDMRTGERRWNCEISSIDTALFIAGALTAGAYFKGTAAERLALKLYDRMDFEWMRTNGGATPDAVSLSHGYKPESGFLKNRWDDSSEHALLDLLALGSRTHPVPAGLWDGWRREKREIGPYRAFGIDLPLFVHQYLHCYAALRDRPDARGEDFWRNAVEMTRANRWYCIQRSGEFPGFGPDGWGLTAVDGPDGYRAYAPAKGEVDGTLGPMAVVAAVPLLPKESIETIRAMIRREGNRIVGRYGLSSYNVARDWRGEDIVGLDAGAALLMLDRCVRRDDFVPSLLEREALGRGLRRAGFKRVHNEIRQRS